MSRTSQAPANSAFLRPDVEPAWVYPSSDPGLPAANVASLLAAHAPLLARLRVAVADDAGFQRCHLPAIEALARTVHLLPASAHAHFSGAGGLFRLSLECALFCFEAAAGRAAALCGAAQQRQLLAPRWQHAAFLAGLVCELRSALPCVVVCDPQGREWPAFGASLDAWLDEVGAPRYHVNWLPDAGRSVARAQGVALLARLFPAASVAWLDEGSSSIVRELYAVALGDPEACDSPLADLVAAVRREVLRREAAWRPASHCPLQSGYPLDWLLLDALRSRFEAGEWSPGAVGQGMSWWQSGVLCLRWPDAGQALVADLLARGLVGVPRASLTLVECLAAARMLVPDERGRWIWSGVTTNSPALAGTSPPGTTPADAVSADATPPGSMPAALHFADAARLLPALAGPADGPGFRHLAPP